MHEMTDLAEEQEQSESEPRSATVSFPDHYLIPYIEMCKRSKFITCGCSVAFIGLAIFCFFATNYMINYPVTKSRKIAFVFAGVFCLVVAASCLELRFRILQLCREDPDDNVQFEIVRRDTQFSDSFSAHFEDETAFCHGTPIEGLSQTETPEDSSSTAHTIDDPCFADVSTSRCNGHARRLPRHSISDNISPDIPLLPLSKPLNISKPSCTKKRLDYKRLHNGGSISDNDKYPPNYSTFENGCAASDTEPLLAESMFKNGCDNPETEPYRAKSTADTSETESLPDVSVFEDDYDTVESQPLLADKA